MSTIRVRQFDASAADFQSQLQQLLAWESMSDPKVNKIVDEVLHRVKHEGDAALLEYTRRFDSVEASSVSQLKVSTDRIQQALKSIDDKQRKALEQAAERVRSYHQHQFQDSWQFREADGTLLGQQVRAMDRVGLYVPGGKASYPSSVLMNAIPAKVAGVEQLVMVTPSPGGELNDIVLAAAAIAGVSEIYTVGGAQAIAALAYGTESIAKVDKIVGPGNIFVATAKRAVFGQVAIDMIAGPSEILIYCDGKTNPDWIAMDLFSQAEHDEQAQSILIAEDQDFLDQVQASIDKLLPTLSRSAIAAESLKNRGAFIKVSDVKQACNIINQIAPEHLELSIENPELLLPEIRHAGAIFMGRYTAEALGDYCAGPNHVLPTSGTARFSSPLGVYDFQKRSSLIMCSAEGASELGKIASTLAHGESLEAHARSAEYRILD